MNRFYAAACLTMIVLPITYMVFPEPQSSSREQSRPYKEVVQYIQKSKERMKQEILQFIREIGESLEEAESVAKGLRALEESPGRLGRMLADFQKAGAVGHASLLKGLDHFLLWVNVICIKSVQDKKMSISERDALIDMADRVVREIRKTAGKTLSNFNKAVDKL